MSPNLRSSSGQAIRVGFSARANKMKAIRMESVNLTFPILGQDSTFFRGTLEKMQSEGLQNCPRAAERRVESLHYTLVLPVYHRFPRSSLFVTNRDDLGSTAKL